MISTLLTLLFTAFGVVIGWLARGNRDADMQSRQLRKLTKSIEERSPDSLVDALSLQLSPLQEGLSELGAHISQLEVETDHSTHALNQKLTAIVANSTKTNDLLAALNGSQPHGRWGDIQLRRIIELAGMEEHIDFDTSPEFRFLLSGGQSLRLDNKAPYEAYLEATESAHPASALKRHAAQMRNYVSEIATHKPAEEYVIAFIPGDAFLSAALSKDAELLEFSFSQRVVLATPTTLLLVLRTIALGFQEQETTEKIAEVQRLGKQLQKRLNAMADQFNRVGSSLEKAVQAFNDTLYGIDNQVLSIARQLSADDPLPTRITQTHAIKGHSEHFVSTEGVDKLSD